MINNVPRKWRNLLADYPEFAREKMPEVKKGVTQVDYSSIPKMPLSIGRQSFDTTNKYIAIPDEVMALYSLYRPTPLKRARNFENELGTSCKIFYKYEGANISGSHKLNSAIAQAYYYKKAGVKHIVTGTGAGQWGTAIAYACQHFGLKCTIFMPKVSLRQKPQRRSMMEVFGARLIESPSSETELGRKISHESPDKLGTLAIATGEALELTFSEERTQFAVGSGENHVLLHQTVIGEEAKMQMEAMGEWPDQIFACMGAGSNFAGVTFPFIGDEKNRSTPRCIAAEPAACPKMTQGKYAYTETDFSGTTPVARMMTLGATYDAPGIHAGGLRYHGTSPLISAMFNEKIFEARAYPQTKTFKEAISFTRCEGVLPAPESAHAICGAAEEASRRKKAEDGITILINISGMGYHDLSGYQEYLSGEMNDGIPDEQSVYESLEQLSEFQERFSL